MPMHTEPICQLSSSFISSHQNSLLLCYSDCELLPSHIPWPGIGESPLANQHVNTLKCECDGWVQTFVSGWADGNEDRWWEDPWGADSSVKFLYVYESLLDMTRRDMKSFHHKAPTYCVHLCVEWNETALKSYLLAFLILWWPLLMVRHMM